MKVPQLEQEGRLHGMRQRREPNLDRDAIDTERGHAERVEGFLNGRRREDDRHHTYLRKNSSAESANPVSNLRDA